MTGSLVSPYCFAEFHSVHAWHHPVAYNECHFVFFQFIPVSYTHLLEKATHEELDRIGKLIKDSGIPVSVSY